MPRFLAIAAIAARRLGGLARPGDRGATAVEYALIASLIAAVIIGIVTVLGGQVGNDFQSVVGSWLGAGRMRRTEEVTAWCAGCRC